MVNMFKSSTKQHCVIRRKRVKPFFKIFLKFLKLSQYFLVP